MGQLIEDLESCVRTAELAGPPWGMYTRMEITAEHAKQILGLLKASRTILEEEQETAPDRDFSLQRQRSGLSQSILVTYALQHYQGLPSLSY